MDINVENYSRLIYSIIGKYSNLCDIEDLYQVGMIGLLKASNNYDTDYETKFSTYAHTYILGEVLKYIRENKLVKVSRDLIRLNGRIEKAKEILSQKYMREVTTSEIASFLEIDENLINDAINSSNYVKSLDYELNDEGQELNLYDSIKYEDKALDSDIIDLHSSIDSLNDEEKELIKSRYFDDKTQTDISHSLGISQVQVSRNEAKILKKLRKKIEC